MSTIWIDPTELGAEAQLLGGQAQRASETVVDLVSACRAAVPVTLIAWLDEELDAIARQAMVVALGYMQEALDCKLRADEISTDQSLVATVHPGTMSAAFAGADVSTFSSWLAGMDSPAATETPVDFGAWVASVGNDTPTTWLQPDTGAWTSAIGQPAGQGWSTPDSSGWVAGVTDNPGGAAAPTGLTTTWMGDMSTVDPAANQQWLAALRHFETLHPGAASPAGQLDMFLANNNANIATNTFMPYGISFNNGVYIDDGGDRATSLAGAHRDPYTGRYDL